MDCGGHCIALFQHGFNIVLIPAAIKSGARDLRVLASHLVSLSRPALQPENGVHMVCLLFLCQAQGHLDHLDHFDFSTVIKRMNNNELE